MNIRHLRIFKTVCDESSVTRAAEKLYMTQPAVSHVLHDLEHDLGYPLFDRISRRLYLTAVGKRFLEKANQVLSVYDELQHDAPGYEANAPIRLGSSITIANFWLPPILQKFQMQNSAVVNVEVDRASIIIQKLKENKIDIAFVEGILPQGELESIPFSSYTLKLVYAPAYQPLTALENLSDLVLETLLLRERGSAIRDTFDSYLRLSQLKAEPLWTSVNSQSLLQAARSGLGITVLPDMLVQEDIENGILKELVIEHMKLENQNYILYHREKNMSSSLALLLSLTKQLYCK